MTKSCWHALLETLSVHSSGNKLTHTYTAQYRSNPQLGMHCSGAHQAFYHLLSSQCEWAEPVDAVTDRVVQEVSRACQTGRQ